MVEAAKLSLYIRYSAYTWLILSLFPPYFPYKFLIFPVLIVASYVIVGNVRGTLLIISMYAVLYLLIQVIPAYYMGILALIIIVGVFLHYKKKIDKGEMDGVMDEAQTITAQIQLKACLKLQARGEYVDPKLITKLQEAANGTTKQR